MAAGYDNQNIMGMDNLFATTISGDLGHSGLVNNKGVFLNTLIFCHVFSTSEFRVTIFGHIWLGWLI